MKDAVEPWMLVIGDTMEQAAKWKRPGVVVARPGSPLFGYRFDLVLDLRTDDPDRGIDEWYHQVVKCRISKRGIVVRA